METAAERSLRDSLAIMEPAFRACYEAGVQVVTLPSDRSSARELILAAPFLKRALNDLRAVWDLLLRGYTSQAASVAAALFENALAVTVVARDQAAASELEASTGGDLPWRAQAQSKRAAKIWLRDDREQANAPTTSKESLWRAAYAAYKWLCKIKHPTMPSAVHDAGATTVANGTYVVMAAPDVRPEDLPVKATVAMIAVSRCYEAVHSFAIALQPQADDPYYHDFAKRLTEAFSAGKSAYISLAARHLPFDISSTTFARESAKHLGKR